MEQYLYSQLKNYNATEQNLYKTNWGSTMAFIESAPRINGAQFEESMMANQFKKHFEKMEKQLKEWEAKQEKLKIENKYGANERVPKSKEEEAKFTENEKKRMITNNQLRVAVAETYEKDPFKTHMR